MTFESNGKKTAMKNGWEAGRHFGEYPLAVIAGRF